MDKRKNERHSMKLHTKLSDDSFVSWGLLSDVSENGLFIKSNRESCSQLKDGCNR